MDIASIHQDYLLSYERWLQDGRQLLETFTEPTFQGTKLRFLRHIAQDELFVAARTGNVTAIGNHDTGGPGNPLLANGPKMIMGKIVGNSSAPITAEALTPKKDVAKKFKSDVQDLYNGFLNLKDNDISAIISKPGGYVLLRGVAKMVGLPNAESIDSADMDSAFFADIRQGIKQNEKGKQLSKTLNAKLEENDAIENEDAEEEEVAVKKAAPVKKAAVKKAAPAKKPVLDDDDDA